MIGAQLDIAVAEANGWTRYPTDSVEVGTIWHTDPKRTPFGPVRDVAGYAPSINWAQGGPIIERERIEISPNVTEGDTAWSAWIYGRGVFHQGPTPLVAAMRAYVALRGAA